MENTKRRVNLVISTIFHRSYFILFPLALSPSHSFHLPQPLSFTLTIFDCNHSTSLFNLIFIVIFTFQLLSSLEINDLGVFLDKVLLLDRYLLLKAELRRLYCSLSLYSKQELQHIFRRNILVC